MGWKEVIHSDGYCFLPTLDEIREKNIETGSVCECNVTGCPRLYQVALEDGYWQEVEAIKERGQAPKWLPLSLQLEITGWKEWMEEVKQQALRAKRDKELEEVRAEAREARRQALAMAREHTPSPITKRKWLAW